MAEPGVATSADRTHLAKRCVLVVEDEYFLADDMTRALAQLGADVAGPVPTPRQALVLIETVKIDAAVLDINLRGETVFAVADALLARGVPFVFATGYDSGSIPEAYREVPVWEKPFDPDQLAGKLPGLAGR